MTDLPPSERAGAPAGDATHTEAVVTDREVPAPGTPRWVRVFAAVLVVLALLFVVLHLRGGHGPGRHLPPREGR